MLYPLVTNHPMYMVYAVPNEIEDATTTAQKLYEVLGLSEDDERSYAERTASSTALNFNPSSEEAIKRQGLIDKWHDAFLPKDRYYYPIRERVGDNAIKQLKSMNLKGIGWSEKSYRYYPEKDMGGQLFGFWGYQGDAREGQYGLEGYYDEVLSGKMGEIRSERDASGNLITLGNNEFTEKIDGADLILTINRAIQYKACTELKKSLEKHKSKSGSIIVMEPSTGAILAMCSFPDYDPDKYYQVKDANVFNNKAIFDAYEPGSVFKAITMAAAIDAGAVTPETTYVDTGVVDYKDYKIGNFNDKVYGLSTMTQVLESSINTGVIFAMRAMGTKIFASYVKKFGFG